MSFIGKSAIKKHMALIQSTVGLSACCVILSSCSGGSSSSASGNSGKVPSMTLEVDRWQNDNWEAVSASTPYDLNCHSATSDFKFRLVNGGPGSLKAVGTTVSVLKTSDYTGGPMNGVAGYYVFTAPIQPTMPVAANAASEFTIRLANNNPNPGYDCMLGGMGHNQDGLETALVTISTDDPTNPTFSATIRVFGGS